MSTKKTTQPEKHYIAIDTLRDEIITIGNKTDLIEAIEEYSYGEEWEKEDIEDNVIVYELGQRVDLNIDIQFEINF